MRRERFWIRLLGMLLAVLQAYPLAAQNPSSSLSSPAAQRAMQQVNRIPINGKLTVRKADGVEYHGRLQAVGRDDFHLREVDLKQDLAIRYDEVDTVSRDYGGKGIGGKRVNPRRSRIIGAAIIGGLIVVLAVALAKDKS